LIDERVVISQHRWTTIDPTLVCRHHIAERRTLVKNIVPSEWKIAWRAGLRPISQRQIRDHPRAKLKLRDVRRRVLAIRPHHLPRHELRRREDHALRMKPARLTSIVIDRDDVN